MESGENLPQVGAARVEYVTDPRISELASRMREIDINMVTPLDAHRMLNELIREFSKLED